MVKNLKEKKWEPVREDARREQQGHWWSFYDNEWCCQCKFCGVTPKGDEEKAMYSVDPRYVCLPTVEIL